MPFRQLPQTDATRTTALSALFTKSIGVVDADLPYPVILRGQINTLHPIWLGALGATSGALGAQTTQTSAVEPLAAAFDLVFDHFVQVLHLAVRRGVFERADRTYYGLGLNQGDVPPVYSHADRVLWAGRIAAGETQRIADKPAQPPMSMPSAAQVAAAFAAYMAAHALQSGAKEDYDDEQEDKAALRPQVDALVLEAWDQMEFKYRRESGPSRRRKCREWGVVYVPRAGETPDPEEPEEPEEPTGPGVPTLSSTMESGLLALQMSAVNTTLFNVYEKAPGASEFTLVASGVPTGWTKSLSAGSGEWTYMVRGLAADGTTEGPESNTTTQGV